jgi:uncharacterized Zn finger protein
MPLTRIYAKCYACSPHKLQLVRRHQTICENCGKDLYIPKPLICSKTDFRNKLVAHLMETNGTSYWK